MWLWLTLKTSFILRSNESVICVIQSNVHRVIIWLNSQGWPTITTTACRQGTFDVQVQNSTQTLLEIIHPRCSRDHAVCCQFQYCTERGIAGGRGSRGADGAMEMYVEPRLERWLTRPDPRLVKLHHALSLVTCTEQPQYRTISPSQAHSYSLSQWEWTSRQGHDRHSRHGILAVELFHCRFVCFARLFVIYIFWNSVCEFWIPPLGCRMKKVSVVRQINMFSTGKCCWCEVFCVHTPLLTATSTLGLRRRHLMMSPKPISDTVS